MNRGETEALRSPINKIVLTPDARAPDRHQIDLYGDLAVALALGTGRPAASRGSQVSVVAGTRNYLDLLLTA